MTPQFTKEETDLMSELIESAQQEAIQGINHADSRAFKDLLRKRLELLESANAKLQEPVTNLKM